MFVVTLGDVLVVILLGLFLGLGLIVVVLYKIAETIENRRNKQLEKMRKMGDKK